MRVHVIINTTSGDVHEFEMHAPDAVNAAVAARSQILEQHPGAVVRAVHARHINGNDKAR